MKEKQKSVDNKLANPMTTKQVNVKLKNPNDFKSKYANHFTIRIDSEMVSLTFYETDPPLIIGSPKETEDQYAKIKSIDAIAVDRLAIPLSKFLEFLDVANALTRPIVEAKNAGVGVSDQSANANELERND